jgi:MFS family permease
MWIQQVTLSWLVYELTESATLLGLVNGIRVIPFAITAPFAGVMADRMNRKMLMMVTQVLMAVVAVGFALDVALGYVEVWHVFAFTLLIGTGTGINNAVRQTVTANVVPRRDLVNAVALGSVSFNITRVIGPAVGGYLIGLIGMGGNFLIQAVCYVGTATTILPIKLLQDSAPARRVTFFTSMGEGFKYIGKNKQVLGLIILGLVPMMFIFPINALMPIFAKEYFHMGATGFGVLFTAIGAGSLVGTLTLASFGDVRNKARVFYVALTVAISMGIAFAWTRSLPLALVVLGVQGAFQMAYFSLNNATLQMIVPDNMRGRVVSLNMLDTAVIPLGGLVGGLLADWIGAAWALSIIAIAGLVFVGAAFVALTEVRKL